jgi:hypothetical protein
MTRMEHAPITILAYQNVVVQIVRHDRGRAARRLFAHWTHQVVVIRDVVPHAVPQHLTTIQGPQQSSRNDRVFTRLALRGANTVRTQIAPLRLPRKPNHAIHR